MKLSPVEVERLIMPDGRFGPDVDTIQALRLLAARASGEGSVRLASALWVWSRSLQALRDLDAAQEQRRTGHLHSGW